MFQNFDPTTDRAAVPDRLGRLRAAMTTAGIDGVIVPRADAHQGETVAPCDERLAWLTGFTGSAGSAVVLASRAALFVDGRYTVQAADQTDTACFEVVPSHKTPVSQWLGGVLAAGMRLGYDPWLHGKTEIDTLTAAVTKAGASLVPLEHNLVDTIWDDRPGAPTGAVAIHPDALAGEPSSAKRARLGAELAAAGVSATVMTLPENLAWLLNIRGSDLARSPVAQGFGILHADSTVDLYLDPDKLSGAVREHLGNQVRLHAPAELAAGLAALTGRVRLDRASCPLWIAGRLADIDWAEDPCTAAKARKTEAELAGTRAAHIRDGAAMVRFLHWLDNALETTTLTEIDVVEALEGFRRADPDLMDLSFDTICGSGPNGVINHYHVTRASNRTIQPGDILLVDSGGQYRDGTTDITRTMAVPPVRQDARAPFTLVLKGMIAISTARWPVGLTGRDLDPLARAALWRAGLDYDHGTGHGVGAYLNVHEGPQSLSRRGDKAAFEPGMIVSNEPGYYRLGEFGIRIENLLVVTPASVPPGGDRPMLGFETLALCPIDRRLIDTSLLDAGERAWLDAYHLWVRETLTPLLAPKPAAWLAAATAPLD